MATNTSERTKRTVLTAVFCALAFLVTLLPAPKVQFLSFDIKDTVIATASLLLGLPSACALSVAVPFLEFITVGTTGPWGFLMDVVSTAAFSLTASLIYKHRKTLGGAVLSLITAALMQIAVMMLANVLITPLYLVVDPAEIPAARQTVIGMLIPLLLPFNAVKSVFNAALVMLLYKPISEALRKARLLRSPAGERTAGEYTFRGRTVLVFLSSLLVIAAMLLILFLVMKAGFGSGS